MPITTDFNTFTQEFFKEWNITNPDIFADAEEEEEENTSIYETLSKSLEYSRKSKYEKLEIIETQLEEGKINEGKYLREANKLK